MVENSSKGKKMVLKHFLVRLEERVVFGRHFFCKNLSECCKILCQREMFDQKRILD